MDIKPIETIYNGYRFRSRLEARWAVFFDEAGINYEYEVNGFENKDTGEKYLPDFYLPDYGWHVEVKAPRENAGKEIERANHFIDGKNITVLLLLGNIPKWHEIDFWFYLALYYNPVRKDCDFQWVAVEPSHMDSEYPYGCDFNTWLGVEKKCLPYNIYNLTNHIYPYLTAKHEYEIDEASNYHWSDIFSDYDKDYLHRIYNAARQARFEHGEHGGKSNMKKYQFDDNDIDAICATDTNVERCRLFIEVLLSKNHWKGLYSSKEAASQQLPKDLKEEGITNPFILDRLEKALGFPVR